jgi:eukaryotic-like serine/threonine-protein kinase
MISNRIGRYEIVRLLGEGGVGRVYEAWDPLLGRKVAIKMLRPEAARSREIVERFSNEPRSFSSLKHPNIPEVYDFGLEGQIPYMVMEFIDGHTLFDLLQHIERMPVRECQAVIAQAAAGLTIAHQRNIVHRDIKPENLMITSDGLLKIMDFGIARDLGSQRRTRIDQVFATLLYASPEQLRGSDVDGRSDVYSLGAVAYEMLVGSPPFTADNDADLRSAQLEAAPHPPSSHLPGLDTRVEAAILRALAKHPRDRFDTVGEFCEAIGATAVRGDATGLLQDHFAPILQRHAAERRMLATASSAADSASSSPVTRIASRDDLDAAQLFRERPAAGSSLKRPIAVLGAAVLALAIGVAYVAWPVKIEKNEAQSAENAAGPARPDTVVPAAPKTEPVPLSNPQSATQQQRTTTAPDAPTNNAPPAAQPHDEQVAVLPPPSLSPPQTEQPAAPAPPPAQSTTPPNPGRFDPSALPSSKDVHAPPPRADIVGTVNAIKNASLIRVGTEWIPLCGIDDPTANDPNHIRAMRNYLEPSSGSVQCYQRGGGKYQCLVNGHDLAQMALNGNIGQPVPAVCDR